MMPRPAQYLLRFDDLCPAMDRARRQRFVPMLAEFCIQPILAVVPDNQDPALAQSAPDTEFWAEMRAHEAAGASIGLHGYRHLCAARGRSLMPLHRETEFAGVAEGTQCEWIHAGLEILRAHGLHPDIWVAPRHGFDHATLRALRAEGLRVLSDGFARRPFVRGGVTWIPQQFWAPQARKTGLWTICIHPGAATDAQVDELGAFLQQRAAQFTSVRRVMAEGVPAALSLMERVAEAAGLARVRGRQAVKGLIGRRKV